jgi:signal recognition particle GTPase
LCLTKLDGTAKGGVVISIKQEFDIPVKYIVSGKRSTTAPFDPVEFTEALWDETVMAQLMPATQNKGKLKEFSPLFEPFGLRCSPAACGGGPGVGKPRYLCRKRKA